MRARARRSVSGRGGGMGEAATAGARRGGVDLTGAEIRGTSRTQPAHLPPPPARRVVPAPRARHRRCGGGDGDGAELRFAKFERRRLHECFDFVRAKGLLGCNGTRSSKENVALKGGGAYKFANDFREKLGVCLDKLDEMDSVVSGANFLLQNVPGAAFTHMNGQRNPVDVSPNNLFPYLLVNIGSGVSILKVTGNKKFERVTGTHIGGGTMFGLAKLLTGCKSPHGWLLMHFLYVPARTFQRQLLLLALEKFITSKKGLTDYKPEDLASTLLSAFTYNIAQVSSFYFSFMHIMKLDFLPLGENIGKQRNIFINSWSQRQMQAVFLRHEGYLGALGALMSYGDDNGENLTLEESEDIAYFVANLSGLKRIFFRGAYVCGHEKTMDKIFSSKGEVQTTFLCHEGFLGTLGAFWSYENMGIDGLASHEVIREVLLGAPYTGQFPSLPVTEQQNVRSVHKHEST
ncbi:hypothetical protein HU200_057469 [Digitaria exilis]|uniref:Uncharacterized protein n=1 Tax=Digitaria exilis TaxID=1010633 RepID=A0A835AE51_9POAL|nr:hypothetical protein HU200_057469 [Digitaria exilis]